MIQDIAPKRLLNHYSSQSPSPESLMLIFKDGDVLLKRIEEEERIAFPTWEDFAGVEDISEEDAVYLFSIDDDRYFLLEAPEKKPAGTAFAPLYSSGFAFHPIRDVMHYPHRKNTEALAAFTGFHLWDWYQTNRFCGACGHPTKPDEKERALKCPSCGHMIYPRINPAVIIGVKNGDRILITRYKAGYAHNALVAGFTEIGETLEETVAREVMEEAGIHVKNIRYYKSQPWGIAEDVLMGFYCEVDGDDTIRMDRSELKYAEWVRREDIVLQPSDYSLTNEMMQMFRDGKEI